MHTNKAALSPMLWEQYFTKSTAFKRRQKSNEANTTNSKSAGLNVILFPEMATAGSFPCSKNFKAI